MAQGGYLMKIAIATLMFISVLSAGSAVSQQSDKSAGEVQQTTPQEDSKAQSSQGNDQSGQSENHSSDSKKHKKKIKKEKKKKEKKSDQDSISPPDN